jgi:hypothetical protein
MYTTKLFFLIHSDIFFINYTLKNKNNYQDERTDKYEEIACYFIYFKIIRFINFFLIINC